MQNITGRFLTLALFVSIAASVFKLMHWTGGNLLLLAGLPSLAVASVILGVTEKSTYSITRGLVIAFACIAVLFKLMHWPDGGLLLKVAIAAGLTWAVYFYFIAKEDAG